MISRKQGQYCFDLVRISRLRLCHKRVACQSLYDLVPLHLGGRLPQFARSRGLFCWSGGEHQLWAYEESEWSLGAQYVWKATDELSIIPGYQYFGKISLDSDGDFTGGDAWRAGVTVDYKVATNLLTKLSVQYYDPDNAAEQVQGFLRFQRTF